MKVPTIPKHLFKYGIKPSSAKTERLFDPKKRSGLHLAGFDTETIGTGLFKHNDLFSVQIAMDNAENSHIFFPEKQGAQNLELFCEIVDKHSHRIFASAHNASFDIGALLGKDVFLLMQGFEVAGWKGKVIDGTTSFAILHNKMLGKTITIADSMAWFKMSLKKFSQAYLGKELQKHDRPDYLGKRAPETPEEFKQFCDYAEQDALIQLEATKRIYSFCLDGGVKTSLTPPQLSGRVFQKHFLDTRIFLPNPKLLTLIARSYHGAQFTAFGRGFFENVHYYDINSLYPFAAIETPLNFSNSELKPISLDDIERGFSGFAALRFKFPETEKYPCLPVYANIRGFPKLVFPLSGFSYCTTEEIKAALEKNVEVTGLKAFGWYPGQQDIDHPLGRYMRDIYSKKEELDKLKEKGPLDESQRNRREYYKLLLNSLIGKFCQRNKTWLSSEEIAGSLFKPDFASLILSKSRAIINGLISKYDAIYSDTDCLLTKKELPTGTKMGQLKDELGNETGDLLSIRSKLYFVSKQGNLLKCAKHGFRQPSELVFKNLLERRKASFVPYSVTRLTRLKEAYRRNRLPRREINQSFKIMLSDDGKRKYFEELRTVEELLAGHSLSEPLKEAGF